MKASVIGSGGTVYVDPALMKELLSFRTDGQEGFVVHSHLEWKATAYVRYRCEPHWRTLLDWLETNGISARKFADAGLACVSFTRKETFRQLALRASYAAVLCAASR